MDLADGVPQLLLKLGQEALRGEISDQPLRQ
jgi:hypothetical protein